MRTIKFRGKDQNNEWHIGYLVVKLGVHYIYEPIWEKSRGEYKKTDRFEEYNVRLETIGQFTGVFDKNGNEIYEGDIVNVRVTNDRFKKNPRFRNGVVTFCEYDGGWAVGCYYRFLPKRMEVIGNIYDNPELTKEE